MTAQFILNRGYAEGIEIVAADAGIDAVLVASSLTRISAVEHEYDRLRAVAASIDKPVVFWSYTRPHPQCVDLLARAGIPLFSSLRGAARAMAGLARYAAARARHVERSDATQPRAPRSAATNDGWDRPGILTEHRVAALFARYDIALAGALASDREQAVALAREARQPVALKVQSAAIPHKSDAGAICLDVSGDAGVAAAYDRVRSAALAFAPDAPIDGVWVQPMAAPGIEMILGIHREPGFGPMMLIGIGGVLVEVLDDSVLAPLPLDARDAEDMLNRLRGRRLLDGVRGAPPSDVPALVALMLRVADVVRDHAPSIDALDLNPVIVHARGEGVTVGDALLYSAHQETN